MTSHLQIPRKDRHSLLPSAARKVILVLMTSQNRQIQFFRFSFLRNDFPKANVGQNATNTAIKPLQCLKGEARDRGLGGNQAYRLKLTKGQDEHKLLVFINSSGAEHACPILTAQNTRVFSSMDLKGWPALTLYFQGLHLCWSFLRYQPQSGNGSHFSTRH